jgi:hypothetical protein
MRRREFILGLAMLAQPDVLFAVTNTSMAALHAEHSSIPTVFAMVGGLFRPQPNLSWS